MNVLAFSGSLRQGSFNSGLVRAAAELAPSGMLIELADISAIPLYNGDDDGDSKPEAVERLARQVQNADALLFATPEYNYSIPGVLKNALLAVTGRERVCRQACRNHGRLHGWHGDQSQSVSPAAGAGVPGCPLLSKPEVFVSAAQKCDDNGDLTDEKTRDMIAKQLQALSWHATLKDKKGQTFDVGSQTSDIFHN